MDDRFSSDIINENDEYVTLKVRGMASAGIQLSGTFVGTLAFEGTINNTTWVSLPFLVPSTGDEATGATAPGLWVGSVGGFYAIRVKATAWTSGAAQVHLRAALSGGGTGNISGGDGSTTVSLETALANTIDSIGVFHGTNAIMNGTTELIPKYAVIDNATSGDNTLVAAVTGKKIRVLSLYLVSGGTVTARFESGASGTALSGQMPTAVNNVIVLPFNPVGWFETEVTTLLNLELGGAVSVDGGLTYVEV